MNGDWWSDKEGHTMTYCCIDATSRDFGRFGLLFARNGMWVEDEVIPSEWITESTSTASGLSYYDLQIVQKRGRLVFVPISLFPFFSLTHSMMLR